MSKALSVDLRERAVAAVRAGATHREAAERFGLSAASVSRWQVLERERGDVRPKALGGDRKSGRIDAHEAAIVEALGPEADRSIEEVRQALRERGLIFSFGASSASSSVTPSRAKKDRARHGARSVPTL
jgi:transposase